MASKGPGRPMREHDSNTQEKIVNAACWLFGRHGVRGTSYRQIADAAHVTPAMVHYYFPKKDTLFLAVIQATFQSTMQRLLKAETLDEWVHHFHDHVMSHPWCPHLMLREVLPVDGNLRELFLEHCAPEMFGSIKQLMRQTLRDAGVTRRLDTDRHIVLLIGMLVYPFLGQSAAQSITGRTFDESMMKRFRQDALSLFHARINELKAS